MYRYRGAHPINATAPDERIKNTPHFSGIMGGDSTVRFFPRLTSMATFTDESYMGFQDLLTRTTQSNAAPRVARLA